jgi:hypothetical protein
MLTAIKTTNITKNFSFKVNKNIWIACISLYLSPVVDRDIFRVEIVIKNQAEGLCFIL